MWPVAKIEVMFCFINQVKVGGEVIYYDSLNHKLVNFSCKGQDSQ